MNAERLQIVLPIVAIAGYFFVRLTLSFLFTHVSNHLQLHDLVRESKTMRREYLDSVKHYPSD